MLILVFQLKPLAKNKERSQKQPYLSQAGKYYIYFTLKLRLRLNSNELALIALFKRVEELPKDKKKIVKELIDAFLFKTEMQEKLKLRIMAKLPCWLRDCRYCFVCLFRIIA